ncbi:MAG: VCBS repeat-containing protein [Ignavibacteria bacterium]|nr:VCBS repeat-containing protein [Ignavibacteria bacterium]
MRIVIMKRIYFLIMALFINSMVLSQSQLPASDTKDWLNSLTDENGKQIMSNSSRVSNNFMENVTIPDVTMTGDADHARFGYSVSSADVNGDGLSDVIVGAYSQDKVFIFFGDTSMNNTADVILTGEEAGSYFGYSVSSAGDVNDDCFSDVIVGAMQYSSNTGRAYIYYGGALMNNTADVILTGEAELNLFGGSVSSAGDVNGDGFSDVIVGAFIIHQGIGRSYIFFGGSSMNNTSDVIMTGVATDNMFGSAVSSGGDVNGDGYSDVIVGGYRYSSWRGRACIFFGGVSMDNTADVIMIGGQAYNYFGILCILCR